MPDKPETERARHDHGLTARLRGWSARMGPVRALGLASLLESSVLPLPIEAALVPAMLGWPGRLWQMAGAVLAGCLAGSLACYLVGAFLLEPVAAPLFELMGLADVFEAAKARLRERGIMAVLLVGLSPLPLPLATVGAGAVGLNIFLALGTVAASRAARYFGLALLVRLFGQPFADWVVRLAPSRFARALLIAGAGAALAGLVFL